MDKIVSYALREYLLIFSNRNDKGSTLSLFPSFIPPLDLPFSPSVPFYSHILIFITLLFPILSKNSCFVSFPLFFLLLLPSYLPRPPSHPAFSLSLCYVIVLFCPFDRDQNLKLFKMWKYFQTVTGNYPFWVKNKCHLHLWLCSAEFHSEFSFFSERKKKIFQKIFPLVSMNSTLKFLFDWPHV